MTDARHIEAQIYERLSKVIDPELGRSITDLGMIAAINGVIVQIIMGSRVLYGLASEGWIHSRFARVHGRFQTPVPATLAVLAAMIIGTVVLPLVSLAQLTSLLVLTIFTLVNRLRRPRW